MAFLQCSFHSDVLGMAMGMNVILPEQTKSQIGQDNVMSEGRVPVLYLLHGYSDDHTIWTRRTSIERYVANYGIAVVIPNVHKSFYSNMKYGDAYWDYISEEIPAKVNSLFQVSSLKEDTFVAGLSMGGYGAFKLALRCPHRYCAAASLSGALDIGEEGGLADIRKAQFGKVFGNGSLYGTEDDLFYLLDQFSDENIKTLKFYQCCGTEDFLYRDNIKYRDRAQSRGLDHIYEEEPGSHNWEYWDYKIQRVLDWMFSKH